MPLLTDLPEPILEQILANLDVRTAPVAAASCRLFNQLIYAPAPASTKRWSRLDVSGRWVGSPPAKEDSFCAFLRRGVGEHVRELKLAVVDDRLRKLLPPMKNVRVLDIFAILTLEMDQQEVLFNLAAKFPALESFSLVSMSWTRKVTWGEPPGELRDFDALLALWPRLVRLELHSGVRVADEETPRASRPTLARVAAFDAFFVPGFSFSDGTLGYLFDQVAEAEKTNDDNPKSLKKLAIGCEGYELPMVSMGVLRRVGHLASLTDLAISLSHSQNIHDLFDALVHLRNLKTLAFQNGELTSGHFVDFMKGAKFDLETLCLDTYFVAASMVEAIAENMTNLRSLIITTCDENYFKGDMAEAVGSLPKLEYLSIQGITYMSGWWSCFLDRCRQGALPALKLISLRPHGGSDGANDNEALQSLREWAKSGSNPQNMDHDDQGEYSGSAVPVGEWELIIVGKVLKLSPEQQERLLTLPGIKYDSKMIDWVFSSDSTKLADGTVVESTNGMVQSIPPPTVAQPFLVPGQGQGDPPGGVVTGGPIVGPWGARLRNQRAGGSLRDLSKPHREWFSFLDTRRRSRSEGASEHRDYMPVPNPANMNMVPGANGWVQLDQVGDWPDFGQG